MANGIVLNEVEEMAREVLDQVGAFGFKHKYAFSENYAVSGRSVQDILSKVCYRASAILEPEDALEVILWLVDNFQVDEVYDDGLEDYVSVLYWPGLTFHGEEEEEEEE